jgi:hypothetical protein
MSAQAARPEASLDVPHTYGVVRRAGDEDRERRVLERLAELETRDSISMSRQGAHGISTTAPISLHRRALRVTSFHGRVTGSTSGKSRDGVRRPRVGQSWEEEDDDDIDGCETNRLSYECDWAYASNLTSRCFIGWPETNLKSNSHLEHGWDEDWECDEGVKEGGDELKRTVRFCLRIGSPSHT